MRKVVYTFKAKHLIFLQQIASATRAYMRVKKMKGICKNIF